MDLANFSEIQKSIISTISEHEGATAAEIAEKLGEPTNTVAARLAQIIQSTGFKIIRREGKGGSQAPFTYSLANGKAGTPLRAKKTVHKRRSKKDSLDLLLTVKVGRRETLTMTVDEARDLFTQLLALQKYFSQ